MNNQDNVVSMQNAARERNTSLVGKLVGEIRQIVADTLPTLVQSLYDKLDDGLFEQGMAEKSEESESLDNLFFDTMRMLRMQRDTFIKSYIKQVIRNFDDFWNLKVESVGQAGMSLDISEENLTLLEDSDLEEDLALDGIISKGMREFSKEVFALNQRFAAMRGIEEVSDEENPLAPAALSKMFPPSISQLKVDLRIKLVIYKLFEREVIHYLGAMYDDLNELLKNAGVLPKLPSRVKKNPVSPAVLRHKEITETAVDDEVESQRHASTGQSEQVSQADQAAMFNTLRGLLKNNRSSRPENYDSLPKVEETDLLSALSGLQSGDQSGELSLDQALNDIGELRKNLGSRLDMGSGAGVVKAFSGMDEDTIDVISMLFEFILDDTNLPDAMKALLSRLQIPMLKVAILDREFFAEKQHPARKLLNLLAKSAVGWVDDGDRSENSLYTRISSVVNRILDDFREDVSIFEGLYDDFYQFINKEERGAEVIEERITEVTKGKEKMKLAQIRVAEVINTRVKGASLPKVVKELLKEGWKDVLMLTYLRQGEESEKWLHVVGLVDKLLWSVQPKTEVADRQKLLKSIPELLKALRAELVEISFDQHALGKILKELQTCHIHALKGKKQVPEETAVPEPGGRNVSDDEEGKAVDMSLSEADETVASGVAELQTSNALELVKEDIIAAPVPSLTAAKGNEKDEFDEQALSLEVGTWVEWTANDDKQLRGKLTWKSAITGTLVFVGRRGTKLAELNLDELAELLRLKKARLLQDTDQPLLERAMNAMVDTLKKTDPNRA